MSSHLLTKLVGSRISVSVGEPWDFESSAGMNRLEGSIISAFLVDSKKPCVLCEVSEFVHDGKTVGQIAVVSRYWKTENLITDLIDGKRVTVHMFFAIDGGTVDALNAREYVDNPKRAHFLIGSMQLAGKVI